jgi:hypothetical protein
MASLAPGPGVVRVVFTYYNTRISPGGSDTAAQDRPSCRPHNRKQPLFAPDLEAGHR